MRDDFNQTCVLIEKVERSVNGLLSVVEHRHLVYCALLSRILTSGNEAATNGTFIEIKLRLPDITEYNGETAVEFDGDRYDVTRVYQDGEVPELTCKRGVR